MPATVTPTARVSARRAAGQCPALGARNAPAARRAPSATAPTCDTPVNTIAPPRRRGGRCAHRRDLRVAKGRRRSAARARSRSSSFSIDSSPMCRLAASSSAASVAHRPAPSDPAQDRPAPEPSKPPGDKAPPRFPAKPRQGLQAFVPGRLRPVRRDGGPRCCSPSPPRRLVLPRRSCHCLPLRHGSRHALPARLQAPVLEVPNTEALVDRTRGRGSHLLSSRSGLLTRQGRGCDAFHFATSPFQETT